MFTEQTLLKDIEDKWGGYGAHYDMVRSMINRIGTLTEAGHDLAEELIKTECPHCPNYSKCECQRQRTIDRWQTLTR